MTDELLLTADMIARPGDRVIASRIESNRAKLASSDSRRRAIADALAQFKAGKVGEHFEPLKPEIVEDRVSGEMG